MYAMHYIYRFTYLFQTNFLHAAECFRYHRLHGSVSTVVTMTSKVNGKTEISTLRRSATPENIDPKIGVNDYVVDPYNHANFCGNRSNGVCSPYC